MSWSVRIRDPEDMHLAGLVVARALERYGPPAAGPLPGNVYLAAGGMRLTVVPVPGGVEIVREEVPPIAVSIRAPLRTLIELCAGRSILWALVRGGLRARGSLWALWALRRLVVAEIARGSRK